MDAALDLMWEKYRGWAKRASMIRAELERWRFITLSLTVAGAVLATLALQLPGWLASAGWTSRVLSAASAASMALAAWSANTMVDPARERNWIRARSLAERAKSESYRYATRSAPYDNDDSQQKLLDKISALTTDGEDVPALNVTDEEARRGRPGSLLSVHEYASTRIEEQLTGFFEPNAAANERKLFAAPEWSSY